MRRSVVLGVVVVAALGLSGCGGDEGNVEASASASSTPTTSQSPSPTVEPETEVTEPEPVSGTVEELDAAVRAYSAAFFGADATTIYGMLSARCAASTDVSTMTGNLMAVQSIYGAGPELLTVDASVDGPVGRATYTYSEASLNVTDQPWVFEGGSWRYDEC